MDLGDVNLNGILQTLAANNNVQWWNTFRKRNGRIRLNIEFGDPTHLDERRDCASDNNLQNGSYKRVSLTQRKRNFIRAQEFRRNQDDSIELPRNKIDHSTPVYHPDISNCVSDPCLSEESITHDQSEQHASYEEPFHDADDGSQISATHEEAVISPIQPKQQQKNTIEKDQGKSDSKPKRKPRTKDMYQLCKRTDCTFGINPSNAFRYPMDNSWNPDLPVTFCVKCPDFRMCANCLQYAYKLHAHHLDFLQPYQPCTEKQLSNWMAYLRSCSDLCDNG